LNLNVIHVELVYSRSCTVLPYRIVIAHSDDFFLFIVENVSEVSSELLDLLLLLHDLVFQLQRVVSELGFAPEDLIPVMHALDDGTCVGSPHIETVTVGRLHTWRVDSVIAFTICATSTSDVVVDLVLGQIG